VDDRWAIDSDIDGVWMRSYDEDELQVKMSGDEWTMRERWDGSAGLKCDGRRKNERDGEKKWQRRNERKTQNEKTRPRNGKNSTSDGK
jgi:hypothetical protein